MSIGDSADRRSRDDPSIERTALKMKYMMLIAGSEEAWEGATPESGKELYDQISRWWDEHAAAGRIVEGHQLQSVATATTVRRNGDGEVTVTDGPFVEGKEVIGGYGILEVADLDEAIAVASSWPAPDVLEIRPVVDGG
jgi:hypothetical protein